MLTVRFPDGTAVVYNRANSFRQNEYGWDLYTADTAKDGQWVASISLASGCIVEGMRPCRVSRKFDTTEQMIDHLVMNARRICKWPEMQKLAELKAVLRDFDARSFRCK